MSLIVAWGSRKLTAARVGGRPCSRAAVLELSSPPVRLRSLALFGIAIGIPSALLAIRLIASMLFGLKPYDPLTLGCASLLLVLIAIAASWVPAWRAAHVDPIKALRHE